LDILTLDSSPFHLYRISLTFSATSFCFPSSFLRILYFLRSGIFALHISFSYTATFPHLSLSLSLSFCFLGRRCETSTARNIDHIHPNHPHLTTILLGLGTPIFFNFEIQLAITPFMYIMTCWPVKKIDLTLTAPNLLVLIEYLTGSYLERMQVRVAARNEQS
jgi:hypothetical protein